MENREEVRSRVFGGRDTVVVYASSQAREAEKHSVAVSETVVLCPSQLPRDPPISETEVEANRVALAIKTKCNLPFR